MIDQFKTLTDLELLQFHSAILAELKFRERIRTFNNPVADYAEWLVANRLGLTLKGNSNAGYDAEDSLKSIRYQIKCRHLTEDNNSVMLGAIRNLDKNSFDYLVAVLFNAEYEVQHVYKIPHEIIGTYAVYRKHVNAHILRLRGKILEDPLVEDITNLFRN